MAFIDSQVYIHQLVILKNFILVGDVMKSVDLLQFQEDYRYEILNEYYVSSHVCTI